MRLARMLLIVMTATLPMAAGAVDVKLGAMVDALYDSNVFRTSSNQKDDGAFRFSPTIEIESVGPKLGGSLYYAPTYEVFTTYSDANNWSHDVRNSINWLPEETTSVSLVSRFQKVYVLNDGDPDTIDEGTAPIPDNDIQRERIYLFNTGLTVGHAINSRWDSTTSADFSLFDTERRNSVNSKTVSAFQGFNYGLTAADRLGGGAGATIQLFDEAPGLPASNTYVYQLFGTYERNFGEKTTVSIRLGPALIHTVQDSASGSRTLTYPHLVIEDDVTWGDLTGMENFPGTDDFGQGLTPTTNVPAGSVLVPDRTTCQNDGSNPVLFEGSRCTKKRLLRNDPGHPDEQAAANAVILGDYSDLSVSGSNDGSNDLRWTIFGEVALTHLWLPTLASTVSYNRRESTANGQGASTIADSVLFLTTWQPSELWDISLRASYVKRKTPTNLSRSFFQLETDTVSGIDLVQVNGLSTVVEADDSVDTHRWSVVLRAARRITRNLSGSIRVSYSDQRSQYTSRSPNDFGNFLAIVGIKYDFAPFRF